MLSSVSDVDRAKRFYEDPEPTDYGSFASFSHPDGNGWVLQEIKHRAPGRYEKDASKAAGLYMEAGR
jgi:hypothetical protein